MSADTHDIKSEVRKYIAVFFALMVLTIITVAISYLDVSVGVAIALALFVATIKASLVAGFFMHLISERALIYSILGFTVFFFFGLLLLPFAETYSIPQGTINLNLQAQVVESGLESHGEAHTDEDGHRGGH